MDGSPAGSPRRLRDHASARGLRRGAWGCLTYSLGIGGLLVAAFAAGGLLHLWPGGGAATLAVLVIGILCFATGAYLGALVDAGFDRAAAPRHLPRVVLIDLLGFGVVAILALLSSMDTGGAGGGHGGAGGGGGTRPGRDTGAPPHTNFAAELVDPTATAAMFGAVSLRPVATGLSTGASSHALLMSVDQRGRTKRPSLAVTVWQGPAALRLWPRLQGRGTAAAGPGDEAVLEGSRLAFRREDTVVQLHLRGYSGDAAVALADIARVADRRLFNPGPVGT